MGWPEWGLGLRGLGSVGVAPFYTLKLKNLSWVTPTWVHPKNLLRLFPSMLEISKYFANFVY